MPFPLSLSPFEEYMLLDDRPDHPMSFVLRFRFQGVFDRDVFRSATRTVLQRHPLLRSVIQKGAAGWLEWKTLADLPPIVRYERQNVERTQAESEGEVPLASSMESIPNFRFLDIRERPGVELILTERGDSTTLFGHFHHASCDAIAALQFLHDIFVVYDQIKSGQAVELTACSPVDEDYLPSRCVYGLTAGKNIRRASKQIHTMFGDDQVFNRNCVPLIPTHVEEQVKNGKQLSRACLSLVFSREETIAYIEHAKKERTTVNNLLTRDLFVALENWRNRFVFVRSHHPWRIAIPVNLRSEEDQHLSAANLVSMVFVDRSRQEIIEPAELLGSINRELDAENRIANAYAFLFALQCARTVPAGLTRVTSSEHCLATCVLSNLVRVFGKSLLAERDGVLRVADIDLVGIDLLPPLRPRTHLAFGVCSYQGELRIAMHYDRQVVTDELASCLLDSLRKSIEVSAGGAEPMVERQASEVRLVNESIQSQALR